MGYDFDKVKQGVDIPTGVKGITTITYPEGKTEIINEGKRNPIKVIKRILETAKKI